MEANRTDCAYQCTWDARTGLWEVLSPGGHVLFEGVERKEAQQICSLMNQRYAQGRAERGEREMMPPVAADHSDAAGDEPEVISSFRPQARPRPLPIHFQLAGRRIGSPATKQELPKRSVAPQATSSQRRDLSRRATARSLPASGRAAPLRIHEPAIA